MGDLYRLYLRDTQVLQSKHTTALQQSSLDFISLYGENCTALPDGPEGRSLYCLNLNCRAPPGRFFWLDLTGWWQDV